MKLWMKTTRLSEASAQKSAAPIVFERPSPMAPPISAPSRSVTSAERSRVSTSTTITPSTIPIARLISSVGWNGRVSEAAHATAATNNARVTRCQGMSRGPRPLLRPPGLRQTGLHLQGVLVIELLQHRIRQPHPVQLPERVIRPVVVEILVMRLEDAPVVGILRRFVGVLAEHHAVLVLGEELRGGVGLPAELVEHRGHFEVHVLLRVELTRGAGQVVPVPVEVRTDEPRLRMLREHVVAFGHQLFERRVDAGRALPAREQV